MYPAYRMSLKMVNEIEHIYWTLLTKPYSKYPIELTKLSS